MHMNTEAQPAVCIGSRELCWCRVFKTSRNDGASEDPRLEEHGKKYKHSFYRMLGDVSISADSAGCCYLS